MLLALNWLSNARPAEQLSEDFGVGVATVKRIKSAFLEGIITKYSATMDPQSPLWVGKDIAHRPPYSRDSNLAFSTAVACGDGVHIKLLTKHTSAMWMSRKGKQSLTFSATNR